MRRAALVAALLVASAPGVARGACDRGVCVDAREVPAGLELVAHHSAAVPVRIRIDLTELENATASPAPGTEVEAAPGGETVVMTLRRDDTAGALRYRYTWLYTVCPRGGAHDDSVLYAMPFGGGAPRRLAQGNDGRSTHTGQSRYAFDFTMPVGTPVLAARPGVVAWVVDAFDEGGTSRKLRDRANQVAVVHDDGTMAEYLHLQQGNRTRPGSRVEAGDPIGKSGNTGLSSEPHLHFHVVACQAVGEWTTVRVRFGGAGGEAFVPVEGRFYGPGTERPSLPDASGR